MVSQGCYPLEAEGQAYRSMQVKKIDTIRAQFLQTRLHARRNLVRRVVAGLAWVLHFRSKGKAPLLPPDFASEGLLRAAHVHSGGVDLAIAALLEQVEDRPELGDGGDAGTCESC